MSHSRRGHEQFGIQIAVLAADQVMKDQEAERLATLRQPPGENPPSVIKPTKIRRIGVRGFWAQGREIKMGEMCTVPASLAKELVFLKKGGICGPTGGCMNIGRMYVGNGAPARPSILVLTRPACGNAGRFGNGGRPAFG
jgi:hypothetical protein